MKTTPTPLPDSSLTHAGIKPVHHPQLNRTIAGQTAIRYLRFARPVQLDHLELPPFVYGRWVPGVPTHPAHLIVSVLNRRTGRWQVVRDIDLPRDPRISGRELSQRLSEAQMNERLAKVLRQKPHRIDLGGLETDHLRVECDREHPVWPNHGECNGGEFSVPFGILNKLAAFGSATVHEAMGRVGLMKPFMRPIFLNPYLVERLDPSPGLRVDPAPTMIAGHRH